MKINYRATIGILLIVSACGLAWTVSYYHEKYLSEQKRADAAEQHVNTAQTITKNVLTTVTLFNQISEANKNAKAQDALESQRAENDIKAAVANDDCANRLIPTDAVKRLREYADGIRSSSGDPATF